MKGETAVTTRASCHEKNKQIPAEIVIPSTASTMMPAASVVRPFSAVMSSWMMLVSTPGALSFASNQPMSFIRIASNSFTLSLYVRFSPPRLKQSF